MTFKSKSLFLAAIAGMVLTACGLLSPVGIEPTQISMEAINTMVAQTLSAQQTQRPPTLEPIPPTLQPVTPTITLTPTLSKPYVVATIDTNCRPGASVAFDAVGALKKDMQAEVLGMWLNGVWYLIVNPSGKTPSKCWVVGYAVYRIGDWSRVPAAFPPPTPTPQ